MLFERIQKLAQGYIKTMGNQGQVLGSGAEALVLTVKGSFSMALTGWGDGIVGTDQSAIGIDEIVGKPIRRGTLKAVLDRYPGQIAGVRVKGATLLN